MAGNIAGAIWRSYDVPHIGTQLRWIASGSDWSRAMLLPTVSLATRPYCPAWSASVSVPRKATMSSISLSVSAGLSPGLLPLKGGSVLRFGQ